MSSTVNYVDRVELSRAVIEHVRKVKLALENDETPPMISTYIGGCFMLIADGLSRSPNFSRYSYREDMVMDAVEDCVKRVGNFKAEAKTRDGLPNAFAYFTQISYFAFLRRIKKENKIVSLHMEMIRNGGLEDFMTSGEEEIPRETVAYIEEIRQRVDEYSRNEATSKMTKGKPKKNLERFTS